MTFHINQIVRGRTSGHFVILSFRMIDDEQYAQLKEVDPITGRTYCGEFALPVTALRSA